MLNDENFDWNVFLSQLKLKIDSLSFDSWIIPMRFEKASGGMLYLSAPSQFMKNWVTSNFKNIMTETLKENNVGLFEIEIGVSSLAKSADYVVINTDTLEQTANDNKEGEIKTDFASLDIKLNSDYTFDKFVIGKPNEFAYNAARKVALEENVHYNPLFIYGGVGVGKTHLMQSIAWHFITNKSQRRFLYLTAEKFMNLYITALRDKNIINFKEMFRSTDVLMIDDFQFISGKEGTQEEFFHTFNTLISQGKQIILSADKSPLELGRIEDRILSRLQAGLAVDIHATTYELRLGILESKVKQLNVKVSRDVLEFLAHTVTSNVRELEGALKRVVSYHQLMSIKIDLNMAMTVLEDILKFKNKTVSIDLIQKKVAEHYSLKLIDMSSAKKDKASSSARHIAMYIAKQITRSSLVEIGRKFGGRDHTTVLYSVKKIEEKLSTDSYLDAEIKLLINIIQKS